MTPDKSQLPTLKQLSSLLELYKEGRYLEAIDYGKQLQVVSPSEANITHILGAVQAALGNYDRAIIYFARTIELNAYFVFAYNNLGNAQNELGKFDDAVKSCQKAIKLDPCLTEAYNNMGIALNHLEKREGAIRSYKTALRIKADYVEAYNNLGNTLHEVEKYEDAINSYSKAIQLTPNLLEAYHNLAGVSLHFGEEKKALRFFVRTLCIDPEHAPARHMISALQGKTTETAPRDYIIGLFDRYAASFDENLTKNLSYKTPELLRQLYNDHVRTAIMHSNAIDLGCGTGLSGAAFSSVCEQLTGIDLSRRMIDKAQKKSIYDHLVVGDILETLEEYSKRETTFDLFICADVMVYIGDCEGLFRSIKEVSTDGALFIFSTEYDEGNYFSLNKGGRYSHSDQYIKSCAQKFNYKLIACQKCFLRSEKERYLDGSLFILENRKNT